MNQTKNFLGWYACIAVLFTLIANAQPCTYLAYEGFNNTANLPLNGLSGGTGWTTAWNVQNETMTIPGYQINSTNGSLTYNALQTLGNHARGGYAYLTLGRRLDYNDGGAFDDYVATNQDGIGSQTGDTLWVSYLLRKDANNDEPVWIDLHNDGNVAWCSNCANQHIAVGYFGGQNSNVSGQRRWTLQLNGNYYPTAVPVTTTNSVFVVLRMVFGANNTNVALFINPATLGNNIPTTPTLTQTTTTPNIIRSAAVYLGNNANNGAIDELRLATSYACVAPDNTIAVNLPPTAAITATPTTGQVPLAVTFSGTNSTDPENSSLTYQWNLGDGTTATTSTVSHTYSDILGSINVSLTVTDNMGLQHTAYQTITLLDENNTFPCQTSFTVSNMPTCANNNGRISINAANGTTFQLRNANNTLLTPTNGNQYNNLSAGIYQFTANSNTTACTDTFQLHLSIDSTTCAGWQPSSCAMDIGTNMSGFADWGVERPMRNLFKHVRPEPIPFTTTCFCWYVPNILGEMTFDANGYPTHIPQTTSAGNNTVVRYVISSESETGTNLQMNQQYVLLYDGSGTMQVGGGVNVSSNTAGRIQFTLTANNNIFVEILSSAPNNHIRNIRLLRLADENINLTTNPFYQGFIDKIAPFKMLRFMDWGHTNSNPAVEWSDRSTTAYFTYATPTGVPYETMVQLANQTQKDVWICVPHAANDDYIQQMATFFRDNLNPNLNIYLEYSNEVWNWIFPQSHYNVETAPSNLNYGRAYAEKAKNTFRIWHNVFGTQKNRVKRVLGIQTTYNYLNEQILSQLDQDEWDYGAPTHYFGLDHSSTASPVLSATSTPADIITNARNAWLQNKSLFKRDYDQIKLFGKEIATYEGGQHFVGNVFGIPYDYQQAMWDAQYTQGIYDLYDEVLDTIRAWGCRLAGNFSLAGPQESVYGSWGVLNDIDIQAPYLTTAPKYQALLDNIPQRPTPTISGNATVCGNTIQTYTVPAIQNSTYSWTVSNGTILSGQGTNTITVQWNANNIGTVQIEQITP